MNKQLLYFGCTLIFHRLTMNWPWSSNQEDTWDQKPTWMRFGGWLVRDRSDWCERSSCLPLPSLDSTSLRLSMDKRLFANNREFCLDNVNNSVLPCFLQMAARCSANKADIMPLSPGYQLMCCCVIAVGFLFKRAMQNVSVSVSSFVQELACYVDHGLERNSSLRSVNSEPCTGFFKHPPAA